MFLLKKIISEPAALFTVPWPSGQVPVSAVISHPQVTQGFYLGCFQGHFNPISVATWLCLIHHKEPNTVRVWRKGILRDSWKLPKNFPLSVSLMLDLTSQDFLIFRY